MEHTASEVAKWFLNHNAYEQKLNGDIEYISDLKLQKLLYYAYGCYLALFNKRLFREPILAWQHGPVVESVYHEYKKFGAQGIDTFEPVTESFTTEEDSVLEWVYETFGQYTAWALRNMTHEETPWKETPQSKVISDALIKEYFKQHYVEET